MKITSSTRCSLCSACIFCTISVAFSILWQHRAVFGTIRHACICIALFSVSTERKVCESAKKKSSAVWMNKVIEIGSENASNATKRCGANAVFAAMAVAHSNPLANVVRLQLQLQLYLQTFCRYWRRFAKTEYIFHSNEPNDRIEIQMAV